MVYAINHAIVSQIWGCNLKTLRGTRTCSAETLLELGVEGKNVLVGKLESVNRSSSRSKGVCPLFAYVLDNFLNLVESIPFDECIAYRDSNDQPE